MSDKRDFDVDMTSGTLIREDKFKARLRKKSYRALSTNVVRGDIAIEAARQGKNEDPRKVPALVRMMRQRELVVEEMQRRVAAGYSPPEARVAMKPAEIKGSAQAGGRIRKLPGLAIPPSVVKLKTLDMRGESPSQG